MLFIATGHPNDELRTITMTPQEARILSEDLIRCADEAEDHGLFEVCVKNLTRRHVEADLVLRVNARLG